MPTFEKIDSMEMKLTSPDNQEFVKAAQEVGRFVVLSPLERTVLSLAYLDNDLRNDAEVGSLLEPPRRPSTITKLRLEAIRRLEIAKEIPLDALGLSTRTKNAICRQFGFSVTPEELMNLSEAKRLNIRSFGAKCLEELNSRLAIFSENQDPKVE